MMPSINKIPHSTDLKLITVHKTMDALTCPRYYYNRWICNLEPKWLNLAFWYGSVAGEGAESLMRGKSWKYAQRMMQKESKRYTDRYQIREEDKEKMILQRGVIDAMLRAFVEQPSFQTFKIDDSQSSFAVRLKQSGLLFVGTKDGDGLVEDKPCMFELKNFKTIPKRDDLRSDLAKNIQVNGYCYASRLSENKYVEMCQYMIFRKTSKKMKQGGRLWKTKCRFINSDGEVSEEAIETRRPQTVEQYVGEIAADIYREPEKFFVFEQVNLVKQRVSEIGFDIEATASDLLAKYQRLGSDVIDSHNWPRSEACSNYSGCEFRRLCDDPSRRRLYLRDFQMRELRYEQEHDELV